MSQKAFDVSQAGQTSTKHTHIRGAILGLQGDVLQGWALDSVRPEQRLVVEIFVDGTSVALARADQFEPEAPIGDLFHGFAVQLRQSWLDDAALITAHIANQDLVLDGQVRIPAPTTQNASAITAQVWHSGGLRVSGWAWDPALPTRHMQISVQEGNRVIAQALCNEHHQALVYRTSANHGFTLDLPWEIADGQLHILNVVNDLGQPLPGSPIRLCCHPEGIEGLLQRLDIPKNDPTFKLLEGVAKEQAVRLPKSAGWHLYPQWFKAFQSLDNVSSPILKSTLGILLISAGDKTLEDISLANVNDGSVSVQAVAIAPPEQVAPALQKLLNAGCDRIIAITAGDRLARHALPHLSALLDDKSAWGYADCDHDDEYGNRSYPWLKPIWDVDLFIGADIYTPGAIFGNDVIQRALCSIDEYSSNKSVHWYDFIAAVAWITERDKLVVSHLPRVLYHRQHTAPVSPEQSVRSPQRRQAISWLCERLAPGTTVSELASYPALLRAHWPLPKILPRVSLIVPTKDQYKLLSTCIDGLINHTDYPNLEIIIVDNQSTDIETLNYLEQLQEQGLTILRHPYPFNYSIINNRAARIATGDLIGLINNDIEIISRDWLKELVTQLLRPSVGAVGAKLLWPNHMVQHGGVVVGINGLAAHVGNKIARCDPGYLATNQLTRRLSAVTAACLLMRKSVFEQLDGLDENNYPVAFNDVDLCLRIRSLNLNIVWCASSELIHAESASRGKDLSTEKQSRALREQRNFIESWCITGTNDKHYHPALSLDYLSEPYGGLAIPFKYPQARS
ncbi:glycosyltransferase family 2 protein [Pseudomonas alabamensis]|uniref:glycosyltransferase family 2 protein n=1 Tax=Pseudomonas alabamensis TaxID=3064349 RepID=UPI000745D121|nr:glycosyl transferase [Pseudomonas monteilii]